MVLLVTELGEPSPLPHREIKAVFDPLGDPQPGQGPAAMMIASFKC